MSEFRDVRISKVENGYELVRTHHSGVWVYETFDSMLAGLAEMMEEGPPKSDSNAFMDRYLAASRAVPRSATGKKREKLREATGVVIWAALKLRAKKWSDPADRNAGHALERIAAELINEPPKND